MCKIADWIVWILLLICGIYDYKRKRIPVVLLVLASVAVLIFVMCFNKATLWSRLWGGMLGIVFFLISKYTKEAVGYGDSWIILLLGVYLGRMEALKVLLLAAIGAAVFALFCLWKQHWKRNVTIPFVPFLVAAYAGAMFL